MLKASPMDRRKVQRSERGAIAFLEYHVPVFRGIRVKRKSVNAYLAGGGFWVDVHISKGDYSPEDERLFKSVLDSIRTRHPHAGGPDAVR